jgi:hypothetical protein
VEVGEEESGTTEEEEAAVCTTMEYAIIGREAAAEEDQPADSYTRLRDNKDKTPSGTTVRLEAVWCRHRARR